MLCWRGNFKLALKCFWTSPPFLLLKHWWWYCGNNIEVLLCWHCLQYSLVLIFKAKSKYGTDGSNFSILWSKLLLHFCGFPTRVFKFAFIKLQKNSPRTYIGTCEEGKDLKTNKSTYISTVHCFRNKGILARRSVPCSCGSAARGLFGYKNKLGHLPMQNDIS